MLGHVRDNFVKADDGQYKTDYYGNVLTGSGIRGGESGKPWRGFDPTAKGRHWAIPGKIWDEVGIDPAGLSQHEKLDLLYEKGFITITEGEAWPMYQLTVSPGMVQPHRTCGHISPIPRVPSSEQQLASTQTFAGLGPQRRRTAWLSDTEAAWCATPHHQRVQPAREISFSIRFVDAEPALRQPRCLRGAGSASTFRHSLLS